MIYIGGVIFVLYLIFKFIYICFPLKQKRQEEHERVMRYKSFAILVPAYNEKSVIINCVNSLKKLQYPNYSVYVINDGSDDGMYDVLNEDLRFVPANLKQNHRLEHKRIISKMRSGIYSNIYVINKENGGKADALNAGIACCREEIVVTLDADCMLKEDALDVMNRTFQDRRVVAAGGTVHITQSINSNDTERMIFKLKRLIKYQVIQYLIAFYLHKITQSNFRSLIVISGAYGAFKKNLLLRLNGYRKSVGEDMDITLKIQQYIKASDKRYIMLYVPESVCFTECPENFINLMKQRVRWQKAFIDCALKYGYKMFRRFKPGISFFFIFDYFVLGTVTTFLVLLIPFFILFGEGVPIVFFILIAIDFVLGAVECFVSKKVAKRYNYCFEGKDNLRVGIFIPFKLIIFTLLNMIFVLAGTFAYIINKERWNKAERLGRCFSGPAQMQFSEHAVKAK